MKFEPIAYASHYGGRCRGCADENGVCPTTGMPCDLDERLKAAAHCLKAWQFGIEHGHMDNPFLPAPAPKTSAHVHGGMPSDLKTSAAVMKLIESAKTKLEAMTPEEQQAMWQAQRESWVRGEMQLDRTDAPAPPAQTLGWVTVRVEDTGDGLIINPDDALKWRLRDDQAYEGHFLPNGTYRVAIPAQPPQQNVLAPVDAKERKE